MIFLLLYFTLGFLFTLFVGLGFHVDGENPKDVLLISVLFFFLWLPILLAFVWVKLFGGK